MNNREGKETKRGSVWKWGSKK